MKAFYSLLRPLPLLTVWLLPLALPAQEPAAKENAPAAKESTPKELAPASLHDEMGAINRNVRKLTRQYADPAQKASSLEIVAALQKSTEASKNNFPEKAQKMAEDEKAKYIALFTKDMEALSKQLADLKEAIEAGDNAKAKAQLDALNQLKNTSHKELGVKEDRRGGGGSGGGRVRPGADASTPGGAQPVPTQPAASPSASTSAPSPQP